MEAMRSTWTDKRLDDLNETVSGIAEDVRHQSGRIDSLQHTILVVGGSLFAAFVAFLVAMVGLIITLLVTHF
jgi:Flp pilus assembly protein TadB